MYKYVTVTASKRRKMAEEDGHRAATPPDVADKDTESAASGDKTFVLREVTGDLFSCPSTDSLAHCISEDCRMGKGIAVLFKSKFGGVSDLLKQSPTTGSVCVLRRNPRYIYYLITKKKYSDKPTYDSLRASLVAMREHAEKNNVTAIAMPRIGCGLDGLQWDKVKNILQEVFDKTSVTITVYTLEQMGQGRGMGRGRGR